jgi:hypothetical protein
MWVGVDEDEIIGYMPPTHRLYQNLKQKNNPFLCREIRDLTSSPYIFSMKNNLYASQT